MIRFYFFLIISIFTSSCKASLLKRAKDCLDEKKYEEAISLYHKQINISADGEEAWLSKYMTGVCYEHLGNWEAASSSYLETYELNPRRAEPLQRLARHYRTIGENSLSYLYAKKGSLLPPIEKSFWDEPYGEFTFDHDLSIVSYFTPFKEDGFKAANNLLLKRGVSHELKDTASTNILFYVENLEGVRFQKIQPTFPSIEGSRQEHYFPFNPSICKTENGYLLICRTSNYFSRGGWEYISLAPDGVIRTKNYLIELTKNFEPISQREIEDDFQNPVYSHPRVKGREDCRLFSYNREPWFTYTVPAPIPYIALCKIGKEDKVDIETTTYLDRPNPFRVEKNWLPFEKDGKIVVVYSADPFILYQIDPNSGAYAEILKYIPQSDFSRFRGSASPLPFGEGYLALFHEVSFDFENHRRFYLHRFAYLDSDFRIKKVSKPFTFKNLGIEYCCGMELTYREDEIVMTIGIEDKEAYFAFAPVETIVNMLENYD